MVLKDLSVRYQSQARTVEKKNMPAMSDLTLLAS